MDLNNINNKELDNLILTTYEKIEPLIKKLYKKVSYVQNLDTFDDFKNISLFAIFKCLKEYNPDLNDNLCAYLTPYIKGEICDEIRRVKGFYLSEAHYKNYITYKRFIDEFYNTNKRFPTDDEIVGGTNLTITKINHLNDIQISSIPKNEDGVEYEYPEDKNDSLELLINKEKISKLHEAIERLKPEYRDIVRLLLQGYDAKRIYVEKECSRQNIGKKKTKILKILKQDLTNSGISL